MRTTHRRVLAATVVACGLALGACSGDDDRRPVDGTIVQPGKPGEKAKVLDEAPEITPERANDADVEFAQMMIPHHAQALEMAALAPRAGGSRAVRVLADRIDGAQRPEIVLMAGWLRDQGLEAPTKAQVESGRIPTGRLGGHGGHGGHGSGHTMPGMATKAQMARLAKARGAAFDRQFLTLMVMHHQGAIEMAGEVVRKGADQRINELATGIAADQTAEIDRMRKLLADG
ncbi:MAG: DUF305 domain-containing protein [Aeromicrobium erythreum]